MNIKDSILELEIVISEKKAEYNRLRGSYPPYPTLELYRSIEKLEELLKFLKFYSNDKYWDFQL